MFFSHLTLKLGCSKAKEGHSKEKIYQHQQLAKEKTTDINNQKNSILENHQPGKKHHDNGGEKGEEGEKGD